MMLVAVEIIAGIAVWAIGAIVVAQYINKDIEHRRDKGQNMYGAMDWTSEIEYTLPVLTWPIWPILKYTWRLLILCYKFPKRFGEWLWVKRHISELVQEELRHGL